MADDKKLNLFEKLLGIQSELVAPKSQYNNFGKYNYRNCEDILEAVKPLLKKYELTLKISDEIILIGDRFYAKAVVTVINPDDGNKESSTGWAREELAKKGMDGSQITGSASSYARKYALNGLFCIDDTRDSDSTNKHGKDNESDNDIKLTEAQIKRMYALGYKAGYDFNAVKKHVFDKFKVNVEDMTKEQYDMVCNGYEKLKK